MATMGLTYLPIAALVWVLSLGGAYFYGTHSGKQDAESKQLRDEHIVQIAMDAAAVSTANAINAIEVKHVTVNQKVEREVRENVVYRECKHSPDGLRQLNAAITGAEPLDSSELPEANTPGR